ncbi:hypothetical protein TVAG_249330 [Trichomonas vaginalis G3]|uniref:Uncharacterized protein n=1 Tax=Trichomonas vaginalis (strain ATCC PRA-98 / G3) TaxID=412133 RepID=A2DCD6_TRIV3|nr:hypothetical protein TVAGG3_0957370 [Trichomonas vaginalis G3]EAY21873.1 hypothetical protein TVAG_249330 [Trichomonas vaginalis G3]KAI5487653.1 hypothetical protein TVAGG3_0957370 [Trichomonas vaginalis G3]|eukprot:XP_001582859.1 hypothetical protein [Trichomonas vaginalis G3]
MNEVEITSSSSLTFRDSLGTNTLQRCASSLLTYSKSRIGMNVLIFVHTFFSPLQLLASSFILPYFNTLDSADYSSEIRKFFCFFVRILDYDTTFEKIMLCQRIVFFVIIILFIGNVSVYFSLYYFKRRLFSISNLGFCCMHFICRFFLPWSASLFTISIFDLFRKQDFTSFIISLIAFIIDLFFVLYGNSTLTCAPTFYPGVGARWVENNLGDILTTAIFIIIEAEHNFSYNKITDTVLSCIVVGLFIIIFSSYCNGLVFTYMQVNAFIWAISFITIVNYIWDILFTAGVVSSFSSFQITMIVIYPVYKLSYIIALHVNNRILVKIMEAEEQGFAFLDIHCPTKWVNYCCIGFELSNYNLAMIKFGMDKFQNDTITARTYLRFAMLYPNLQTAELSYGLGELEKRAKGNIFDLIILSTFKMEIAKRDDGTNYTKARYIDITKSFVSSFLSYTVQFWKEINASRSNRAISLAMETHERYKAAINMIKELKISGSYIQFLRTSLPLPFFGAPLYVDDQITSDSRKMFHMPSNTTESTESNELQKQPYYLTGKTVHETLAKRFLILQKLVLIIPYISSLLIIVFSFTIVHSIQLYPTNILYLYEKFTNVSNNISSMLYASSTGYYIEQENLNNSMFLNGYSKNLFSTQLLNHTQDINDISLNVTSQLDKLYTTFSTFKYLNLTQFILDQGMTEFVFSDETTRNFTLFPAILNTLIYSSYLYNVTDSEFLSSFRNSFTVVNTIMKFISNSIFPIKESMVHNMHSKVMDILYSAYVVLSILFIVNLFFIIYLNKAYEKYFHTLMMIPKNRISLMIEKIEHLMHKSSRISSKIESPKAFYLK